MTLGRNRIGTRIGALAALLTALALFVAPRAEAAQLYWTTFPADPADPGTVGRANLDGSGANNNFISAPDGACGVAADSSHVYWAAGEGPQGHVARADLFGGAIDNAFIGTTNNLNCGVAVNANSIFFNNHAIGAIARANLDGTGVEQTFVTGGDNPQHPAANSTHLFWTNKDSQSVGRATLSGGDVNQALVTTKCAAPSGVAANDEYVYWANGECGSIGRAKLDGGGVTEIDQDFIELSEGPCGLAIDGSHIYWGRWGNDVSGGFVGRANLDGSGVDEQFVATAPYVCGVAVGPDPVQSTTQPVSQSTPQTKPAAGFKLKPPVRCTKGCKRILVSFDFDADGTVVARQSMLRKKGKGKAKGRSKASASARGKGRRKGLAKLVKRLSQPVNAGVVTLKLKPTAAGKAVLKDTGKLKVNVVFSYMPNGGAASSILRRLTAKPPRVKGARPKGGKPGPRR